MRLASPSKSLGAKVFQSTHPHEGVRLRLARSTNVRKIISIHAPPRRSATPSSWFAIHQYVISIHAPPRRSATLAVVFGLILVKYFNPRTPTKECDFTWLSSSPVLASFQSTHPHEGVRLQYIANRELHLLHIGCQTAEKPTVSVIFE